MQTLFAPPMRHMPFSKSIKSFVYPKYLLKHSSGDICCTLANCKTLKGTVSCTSPLSPHPEIYDFCDICPWIDFRNNEVLPVIMNSLIFPSICRAGSEKIHDKNYEIFKCYYLS